MSKIAPPPPEKPASKRKPAPKPKPKPAPKAGAPKRGRGRPPKWPGLLHLKKRRQEAVTNAYQNEKSAAVTAAYFNREIKARQPQDAKEYVFLAKGKRIVCARRQPPKRIAS